jgi:hypothetical protein
MRENVRGWTAVVAAWTLLLAGQVALAQEVDHALTITIVKGKDGTNDIGKKTSEGITISVTAGGRAVSNAKVTVIFPPSGPSLTTADGKPTAVATTDAGGTVTFSDLKPNNIAGEIDITAIANTGNGAGTVHLKQRNINPLAAAVAPPPASSVAVAPEAVPAAPPASPAPAAPAKAGKSHALIWIVVGVAVAAAVGVVVATHKSSVPSH